MPTAAGPFPPFLAGVASFALGLVSPAWRRPWACSSSAGSSRARVRVRWRASPTCRSAGPGPPSPPEDVRRAVGGVGRAEPRRPRSRRVRHTSTSAGAGCSSACSRSFPILSRWPARRSPASHAIDASGATRRAGSATLSCWPWRSAWRSPASRPASSPRHRAHPRWARDRHPPLRRLLPEGTAAGRARSRRPPSPRRLLRERRLLRRRHVPAPRRLAPARRRPSRCRAVVVGSSLTWTAGSWLTAKRSDAWQPGRAVAIGSIIVGVGIISAAPIVVRATPLWLTFIGWSLAGPGIGIVFTLTAVTALDDVSRRAGGPRRAASCKWPTPWLRPHQRRRRCARRGGRPHRPHAVAGPRVAVLAGGRGRRRRHARRSTGPRAPARVCSDQLTRRLALGEHRREQVAARSTRASTSAASKTSRLTVGAAAPRPTSTGVDTVGRGRARSEYGAIVVLCRLFWLQSMNTLFGRTALAIA